MPTVKEAAQRLRDLINATADHVKDPHKDVRIFAHRIINAGAEVFAERIEPTNQPTYKDAAAWLSSLVGGNAAGTELRALAFDIIDAAENVPQNANAATAALIEQVYLARRSSGSVISAQAMTILRLLADAPKFEAPGLAKDMAPQSPALQCQVELKTRPAPLNGVLSVTPEGTLRLLTPGETPDRKPILVEAFFDFDDVSSVCVSHDIPKPSIITARS